MKTNIVPGQYRQVSVATVDFALTPDALTDHFEGREVYRHTRFVVVRRCGEEAALVEVAREPGDALFSPVTAVAVLALPEDCAYVTSPDTDTGVPSALAAVARASAPDARCVVVEGRYGHVSFILEPEPIRVRVADLVPPGPPKLLDQAARVLEGAEELAPIELVPEVVDLADLARRHPADHYLLPCRGSGFASGGATVSFLDERPPRHDWTLIGCARSRAIHEWFYGDLPPAVEACPRQLAARDDSPLLTKCCLLESSNRTEGSSVTVPWGASLALVKQALADLSAAADPAWAPV